MTRTEKAEYQDADKLREIVQQLKGEKFKLDCGHHVTFGYYLGNDIVIRNGKHPEVICLMCGY